MDKSRIKSMEDSFWKQIEETAKKHKDVDIILQDYKKLKEQKWSDEFLKGYVSCLSDLCLIKKLQ